MDRPLGPLGTLIAAHAIANAALVVTNDNAVRCQRGVDLQALHVTCILSSGYLHII
jgi:predicted nucleic acid-binding protein